RRGLFGARGEHPLRLLHATDPGQAHESFGLVTADLPPLAAQEGMHLPSPVDAVVLRMQPGDLRDEQLVSQASGRWQASFRGTISARGDEPTNCRAQHPADGLDPELIPMLVDEADHLVVGRSSSLAKNTLAALRISLARRSSATSRRSRAFSSATSLGSPGRWPVSTSRRRCHTRSVSALIPNSPATCRTALIRFGREGLASSSIRSARSRISGEYF